MILDNICVYDFWQFQLTKKASELPLKYRYQIAQIEDEYFEISHKNDLFRTEIMRYRNRVLNEFDIHNGDVAARIILESEDERPFIAESIGLMDIIVSIEKVWGVPIDPMKCPMSKFQAYINNMPKPKRNAN